MEKKNEKDSKKKGRRQQEGDKNVGEKKDKNDEKKGEENPPQSKEIPKFDAKPHLDPRMIGAITSLSLHYQEIVQPMVENHSYNIISNKAPITPATLINKPTILVIGPPQSGKTTLINYFFNNDEDYTKKCDTLKNSMNNFTHIMNGLSNAHFLPSQAVSNILWPFNNMFELSKENDGTQLQLVTLIHPLLNDINFIDTPGISKKFAESSKFETGYMSLLNSLLDRVDLILFIGTPETLKEPIGMVISELKNVQFKTIFLLNKTEQFKSEKDLQKAKNTYKEFLSFYIKEAETIIYVTSLSKNSKNGSIKEVHDIIQSDMKAMMERINKLPTSYKITRVTSMMKHTLEVFLVAVVQDELLKRAKRQWAHINIKPSEVPNFSKDFVEVGGGVKFIEDNKDLFGRIIIKLDRSKWNNLKVDQVNAIKAFLTLNLPYLMRCANEEPEVLVKFSLPGIGKKEDKPSERTPKKRIIKEIKIDLPNEDDDEDDEEENGKNKDGDMKKKKKGRQIKLNAKVLQQLNS
uniref:G domain-containing protein n=1 Tax=Parastrongyloides trichosuri TaxID=131310 RepID=A0A0N4ZY60_PARTI